MKRGLSIIALFIGFCSFSSISNQIKDISIKQISARSYIIDELKDTVSKQVVNWKECYDKKMAKSGKTVQMSTYDPASGIPIKRIFKHSKQGPTQEITKYDNGKIATRWINEYHESGKLKTKAWYSYVTNEPKWSIKDINNWEFKAFYNYSDKGLLTTRDIHYPEVGKLYEFKYSYDQQDRETSMECLINNTTAYTKHYKYDELGNIGYKKTTSKDGTIKSESVYHYDDMNEIKMEEYHFGKPNELHVKTYEYTYNDNYDWVTKVTSLNGEPIQYDTRSIMYH